MGAHPLYGALSQRGLLDPTKPAYNRSQPDGRLRLTASAFKPPNNAGLHVQWLSSYQMVWLIPSGLVDTQWLVSYRMAWFIQGDEKGWHKRGCELSYDQLWAASLIGPNAVTWRWALSYVHRFTVTRGDIVMSPRSPGWHYIVTPGDVTWRSLNANVRYILRCFCLRLVFFLFFWRLTVLIY